MSDKQLTNCYFHYATLKLTPYSGEIHNSSTLLKHTIQKINSNDFPQEERVVDRYKKRSKQEPRILVHISSTFARGGKRVNGKIALVKNKSPKLWNGKDLIEEVEKDRTQKFVDITNYSIHLASDEPVIMLEFNSSGPRLSDVEFFFRQVIKNHRISKAINSNIHLNLQYSELDKKMTNIFSVTVKFDYSNLPALKGLGLLSPFKNINEESGYKDVRMELNYQKRKEPSGKYIKNIRGLDFGRKFISWLKNESTNIESFDDLKLEYGTDDEEKIIPLDLLKNKTESIIHIPNDYSRKELLDGMENEFNYYLSTGKTHNEPIDNKVKWDKQD